MYEDNITNDSSDASEEASWIDRFLSEYCHRFFCRVDESFIKDSFNLYGLSNSLHLYEPSLRLILDESSDDNSDAMSTDQEELESSAEYLYGRIHSRFILTLDGLHLMKQKYDNREFGSCPRVFCNEQPLLPVGESDCPSKFFLRMYCPSCKEIYRSSLAEEMKIDGAFFGRTFPNVFLMQYPEYVVENGSKYRPTVFGFELSDESPSIKKRTRDLLIGSKSVR